MKRYTALFIACYFSMTGLPGPAQNLPASLPNVTPAGKKVVNTRIDNIGYWQRMTTLGYVIMNPYAVVEDPVYTTSRLYAPGLFPQDSPDVPVTGDQNTTQSENSIFVDPSDEETILNSNNSTDWSGSTVNQLYGASSYYSFDATATWGGTFYGAGGGNSGDPTTAIGTNGRWYIGKISSDGGQSVAYSDNQGQTWLDVPVAPGPGSFNLLDKNHMWIDNSPTSSFEGYLYDAWTAFIYGSERDGQIEVSRSADHGVTWSSPVIVSTGVSAGAFNHGVNLQTGAAGELYVAWAIYDTWPSGNESAIGFTHSVDGGVTFSTATRIISNIFGIRSNGAPGKNMRVNSFPSMTVDKSNSIHSGTIYVVWANIGVPGVNTGSDIDVYLIRSADQGTTWSAPIRVNQDPSGLGKQHYFPWISCDPATGNLSVVYYSDEQTTSSKLETWVSYSYDGGDTWTDLKVSDVAFTPTPIPGLAVSYFGDYIGVTSNNMKVYPVWTDNRNGHAMAYVSPLNLGPPPNQPYVMYYSNELSSISLKSGQNMNYGDSLYLSLGLINEGDQPASSLHAVLSTTSPYILMTDSTEDYGSMAPGEIKVLPNGYSFKVSDTIPDNLKVRFDVKVSDTDTTWISKFSIEAHAPHLAITKMVVRDSAGGNNNKRLDPGETADIEVTTRNTGDFTCNSTYVLLSSPSEVLTVNSDSSYLDTLSPGQSKVSVFTVTVGEDASIGTGILMSFMARSGLYHTEATYQETLGIIVEDWETHTFTKFPWQFAGNAQWVLTNVDPWEGVYASESPWIYDNQSATLWVSYASSVDDSIAFHVKTSTESGWDFLYFYVDEIEQGRWSGETPWTRVAFPVLAGNHIFRWSYVKDIYASSGADRTWLDFIEFPPPILPVVNAGPDDTICAGMTYTLAATASLYDSIRWFTHGDGAFNNDTLLNPVYTPGPNDLAAGSVKLTLRGYAQYGQTGNSMLLAIGSIPSVNIAIDPKDTLCQNQSATLTADGGPGGTYEWSPGGLTTPEITVDTSITGGLGTFRYEVFYTNPYGCSCSDSAFLTFRDCTGIDEVSNTFWFRVSPNPGPGTFRLDINAPAPEQVDLRLYNSNKALVWSEDHLQLSGRSQKTLHFEKFAPGLYLLDIDRTSGIVTEKLIITR